MKHKRKIIYLAGFLFSLPVALATYINSSFLASFIGEKFVGIIYALGSITSIVALLLAPNIFRRIGGYRFLLWITLLDAVTFLALTLARSPLAVIIIFILGISLNTLIVFSLDEILKIFSRDSATGSIHGIYLAISQLAWIISQVFLGSLFGGYSFTNIYFMSFIFMTLFLVIAFVSLKKIPDPKYDTTKTLQNVKNFFQKKNLFRAYILSFLIQLFYTWMIIYTPIYLYAHLGFNWKQIGLIFAIMLLPFLVIPFQAGKYSDRIGERKILMYGFTITALFTLLLFYIHGHSVWIWALMLFITRIGAASVEVTSDAYFFKHIVSKNDEFVGVYRSASPVAYILGPLCAFVIFLFVPAFNYIYLILSVIMLFGIYLSSTIRRSDI